MQHGDAVRAEGAVAAVDGRDPIVTPPVLEHLQPRQFQMYDILRRDLGSGCGLARYTTRCDRKVSLLGLGVLSSCPIRLVFHAYLREEVSLKDVEVCAVDEGVRQDARVVYVVGARDPQVGVERALGKCGREDARPICHTAHRRHREFEAKSSGGW